MSDKYATVCNFRESTSVFNKGARAYVCDSGKGVHYNRIRIRVRAKSRGGRWVTTWVHSKLLTNFRRATIPPGHPIYREQHDIGDVWLDDTKDKTYWRFEPARLNAIVKEVSE